MRVFPCRVAIVGAGNISKLHLDGLRRHPERAMAVALMDTDEKTLVHRSEEYGISETYTDLSELIDNAVFDVAIVCTPTHIRAEVIVPLLESGIPVMCEKPFAETYAEASLIAEQSASLRVPVAINQNFRRHFAFSVVRDDIARGKAGKPLHLTQTARHMRHDRGWRLNRERYVMSVMTIHWLDSYRWLFGEEPQSIYVRGVNSPATKGGKDTAISLVADFPSGVVACLNESFSSFVPHNDCGLDCENAGYALDYSRALLIEPGMEPRELRNPFDKADATYYLLDDLLTAHKEKREPETSAKDNLLSMRCLEAAYRSLESGVPVNPAEIMP